jgi:serine/threonine protein kinase
MWDVASSLAYLHERGIYHGDIAPRNCLLTTNRQDGSSSARSRALLCDFGHSYCKANGDLWHRGTSVDLMPADYSLHRIPPDQYTDMYQFGVMLAEVFLMRSDFKVADFMAGRCWEGRIPESMCRDKELLQDMDQARSTHSLVYDLAVKLTVASHETPKLSAVGTADALLMIIKVVEGLCSRPGVSTGGASGAGSAVRPNHSTQSFDDSIAGPPITSLSLRDMSARVDQIIHDGPNLHQGCTQCYQVELTVSVSADMCKPQSSHHATQSLDAFLIFGITPHRLPS